MTVGRYLWSKSVFLVSANFHTNKQLPAIALEKANDFVHLRSHSALTFSLMALHFGLGNVIFIFKAMIVLKESLDINEQRQSR